MLWARLLAYVTGTVNQELLLRNEYLAAENKILRGQIKVGCYSQKKKKPPWPKPLTGWDERHWRKWPEQRNPIRFWAGIGGSSQTNLMDRDFASEWADPGLLRKSSV
jgi:hypothetical protein